MPDFYKNLKRLEDYLDKIITIQQLEDGIIKINDHYIDTNQQLEMLTPAFFTGTSEDNPTIMAYKRLFQKMGILPSKTPEIPLIRDIPLRTKTQNQQEEQQAIFAQFLEQYIINNQWSMLFPDEFSELKAAIKLCLRTKAKPLATKKVTVDEESGAKLTSGGYILEQHLIHGIKLWIHQSESESEKDTSAAIEKTLNNTRNNRLIVDTLKPKLVQNKKVAFNVRGVSQTIASREDLQNKPRGGGHQHFLMLDRTTKTIYAINDTKRATDEDPRAFKQQIELFLKSVGDETQYKFEYIQGKSRQPEDKAYLRQVCSISQFLHYAAILSGVDVHNIQDTVPAKISTLMYLLQYAVINKNDELFHTLDEVIHQLNQFIEQDNTSKIQSDEPLIKSIETTKDNKINQIKTYFQNHHIHTVIERLEQGVKSYNPYWINSTYKLKCIIDSLEDCMNEGNNIDDLLADTNSDLSQAVNMRRLPQFNFFGACKENAVKSREIINELIP